MYKKEHGSFQLYSQTELQGGAAIFLSLYIPTFSSPYNIFTKVFNRYFNDVSCRNVSRDRKEGRPISLFFRLHELFAADSSSRAANLLVLVTTADTGRDIPLQLLQHIKTLLCHPFRPSRTPFWNLC